MAQERASLKIISNIIAKWKIIALILLGIALTVFYFYCSFEFIYIPPTEPVYDARVIAGSHSQIMYVISGFALTGLFLLASLNQKNVRYKDTMLIMFIVFIVGLLASHSFSGATGDTKYHAYIGFVFPGSLFAINAMLLINGMIRLIDTILVKRSDKFIVRIVHFIGIIVVLFAIFRIIEDLRLIYALTRTPLDFHSYYEYLFWIAILPIYFSWCLSQIKLIKDFMMSIYYISIVVITGFSFIIAISYSLYFYPQMIIHGDSFLMPCFVPQSLMFLVSFSGGLLLLIAPPYPDKPVP